MYGLIGEKLGHSFSKTIHEHLWAQHYDLMPMDREALDRFLRQRSFDGVNVTIPYKRTVMPYCDAIDEKARAIGCVNTLVCRDGRLVGYNTDFDGLAYCLDRAGITLGTTGMYKAGRDMEPGTYRITPLTFGSGYYALYNDVRYYYDYIDEYAALFEPVTVNIAEGQYLELFDAGSIERVSD